MNIWNTGDVLTAVKLNRAFDVQGGDTVTGDWTMGTNKKIFFRDPQIYIASLADGFLDFVADTAFRWSTNWMVLTSAGQLQLPTQNATGGLYINNLANVYGDGTRLRIATATGIYFESAVNTIIYHMNWSSFDPNSDGQKNLGASTSYDWNTLYYHSLSQHSELALKANVIEATLIGKLPKVYCYQLKGKDKLGKDILLPEKLGFISEYIRDPLISDGKCFDPVALLAKTVLVVQGHDAEFDVLRARVEALERAKVAA